MPRAALRWSLALLVIVGAGGVLPGQPAAPRELPPPTPMPAPASSGTLPPCNPPAYATGTAALPIDLVTTLRLTDADNPTIALAQARVRQAQARLQGASVLWLPTLTGGGFYAHHSGLIQRAPGVVIDVVRDSEFAGGGPQLRVDSSNAYFLPLVGRRLVRAEAAHAQAVRNNIQYDAVSAYLDLLRVHAHLGINADTMQRAEQMLNRAEVADRTGLARTKADVNRAATEVQLRREERLQLQGEAGAASARLARLLLLQPDVDLTPADPVVVPLELVPPEQTLDQLLDLAIANRPELAANRELLAAQRQRLRQAKLGPLFPKLQVDYLAGGFGGHQLGIDQANPFSGRADFLGQAYWELQNFGLGNLANIREQRAVLDQATARLLEVQALVGAEVSEAAKVAAARFASLTAAQEAVRQAAEMYRKLLDTQFGMVGPRPEYDAVSVLLAIQQLNVARVQYLGAVIEFTRAQFRLFTALGRPPLEGLPQVHPQPVAVPVVPTGPPPSIPGR